ncbi:MAG: InlB B-repeat-containing protein [Bacteroidales bacterium]|nr:InlB B-repeat-containing protein [Bacteroidales bacterium]
MKHLFTMFAIIALGLVTAGAQGNAIEIDISGYSNSSLYLDETGRIKAHGSDDVIALYSDSDHIVLTDPGKTPGINFSFEVQNIDATLQLAGIDIAGDIKVSGNNAPTLTIELADGTTNKVDISSSTEGKAAISATDKSNIVFTGTGSLEALGSNEAAAIGSDKEAHAGIITINSGTITAIAGGSGGVAEKGAMGGENGVGIGAGLLGTVEKIIISGGDITATGGGNGAGIGSNGASSTADGYTDGFAGLSVDGSDLQFSVGAIEITGGTINASGDQTVTQTSSNVDRRLGAGIGTGAYTHIGSLTISGGTVTAQGAYFGAGIGTGLRGAILTIEIKDNANVTAQGGDGGAGIGTGTWPSSLVNYEIENILINGGTIKATGGGGTYETTSGGSGIGSGHGSKVRNIVINSGDITASTNGTAATGIGAGKSGNFNNLTINGGTIKATGSSNWSSGGAAIGSGNSGGFGTITINDGNIEANGHTGIGLGAGSSGRDIIINGGTISATGRTNSAAIGTGRWAKQSGKIHITGGDIVAKGNVGIGGGVSGDISYGIIIDGGNIEATSIHESGAGIGYSWGVQTGNANKNSITINGGTINATGRINGAGIGGATGGNINGGVGVITITDGEITATGGSNSPAIGARSNATGGKVSSININGGDLTLTSGSNTNIAISGKNIGENVNIKVPVELTNPNDIVQTGSGPLEKNTIIYVNESEGAAQVEIEMYNIKGNVYILSPSEVLAFDENFGNEDSDILWISGQNVYLKGDTYPLTSGESATLYLIKSPNVNNPAINSDVEQGSLYEGEAPVLINANADGTAGADFFDNAVSNNITYEVGEGLPLELSLDNATGQVSGSINTLGHHNFTINAKYNDAVIAMQEYTLGVYKNVTLTFTNGSQSIKTIDEKLYTDVVTLDQLLEKEQYPTEVEIQKIGYTFTGYKQLSTNNEFTDDDLNTAVVAGNETFEAQYTVNEYTITLHSNDAEAVTTHVNYTIESNSVDLEPISKNHYTFMGWYNNAEGTGTATSTIPANSYGNKHFYAKWEVIEHTITFNTDGGSNVESMTFSIENAVNNLPEPTKAGYAFAGWFIDEALTEQVTDVEVSEYQHDITLYAKWTPVEYTITFHSSMGNGVNSVTYTVEDEMITLPRPDFIESHTFEGWSHNQNEAINLLTHWNPLAATHVNLYAHWTIKNFTVTFLNDDGTDFDVQTVTYGSDADGSLIPTSQTGGSAFIGWFDGDVQVTDFTTITDDLKVKAKFDTATNLNPQDAQEIKVYPNPATTHLTIEGAERETLSIYSVSGALVKQVSKLSNNQTRQIGDLRKGIYIIKTGNYSQRLVIK